MMQAVLIALIRVYQKTLSRLLFAAFGPVCRFEPSCSRYALACIEGQGALRGSLLSVKRLCKCHPFHPGGYDPPPPPRPGSRAFLEGQRKSLSPAVSGATATLAGPVTMGAPPGTPGATPNPPVTMGAPSGKPGSAPIPLEPLPGAPARAPKLE